MHVRSFLVTFGAHNRRTSLAKATINTNYRFVIHIPSKLKVIMKNRTKIKMSWTIHRVLLIMLPAIMNLICHHWNFSQNNSSINLKKLSCTCVQNIQVQILLNFYYYLVTIDFIRFYSISYFENRLGIDSIFKKSNENRVQFLPGIWNRLRRFSFDWGRIGALSRNSSRESSIL